MVIVLNPPLLEAEVFTFGEMTGAGDVVVFVVAEDDMEKEDEVGCGWCEKVCL